MDGIEIPAWKNNALNITLVYLQSEGTEGYYIYDETKQEVVSVYEPMAVLGQNIVRIDVPENLQKREGMNFTKVKVDGKEFYRDGLLMIKKSRKLCIDLCNERCW